MATGVKNIASGNTLAINSDGEAAVALTKTIANTGFFALAGEVNNDLLGLERSVAKGSISPNGYIRSGVDNIVWRDVFNHGIVQNDAYQTTLATMTTAVVGGYMALNSGNSAAAAAVARVQTFRTFELIGLSTLLATFRVRWIYPPISGNVCEIGFGFVMPSQVTPTGGVYFKLPVSGGSLKGVANYGGVERTVNLLTTPIAGVVYILQLLIDEDLVLFLVNGVVEGYLHRDTRAAALTQSRSQPLLMRIYNQVATPLAQRLEIGELAVSQNDLLSVRSPGSSAISRLAHNSNVTRGVATGQTANYTNSTDPVAATLSNTVAGYTTLGGQWSFAAIAGATTDYALFAYQVPAISAALGNRNLWVTGVSIDTVNVGVAVATATVLQWALGIGSTAVSLATADGTGTRGPRRIPLGTQTFAAAAPIGTQANRIEIRFDQPLMIEAGTFIHVILRMPSGAATASLVFRGIARIDGYYE